MTDDYILIFLTHSSIIKFATEKNKNKYLNGSIEEEKFEYEKL